MTDTLTKAQATALVWDSATPILAFVGFVAVLLLTLSLIGMVSRW